MQARLELWLLHSGSAMGRYHFHDWDADDIQDLRLCVDGAYRIFRYETGMQVREKRA